jgi:hypothetical protein
MDPFEPLLQDAVPNSDGHSPQTAISVGSIGEEYAWVARNLPGARLVNQALTYFERKPFDALTLTIESGNEQEVFFDISTRHCSGPGSFCNIKVALGGTVP